MSGFYATWLPQLVTGKGRLPAAFREFWSARDTSASAVCVRAELLDESARELADVFCRQARLRVAAAVRLAVGEHGRRRLSACRGYARRQVLLAGGGRAGPERGDRSVDLGLSGGRVE